MALVLDCFSFRSRSIDLNDRSLDGPAHYQAVMPKCQYYLMTLHEAEGGRSWKVQAYAMTGPAGPVMAW